MNDTQAVTHEWLEADGLGGFASGTVALERTRRYHALLLTATKPPAERLVLINGFDLVADVAGERIPLSAQRYAPDVLEPRGFEHCLAFAHEPWPTWRFALPDGRTVRQEVFVVHGAPLTVVSFQLEAETRRDAPVILELRPFFSGRDPHALHHENGDAALDPLAHDAVDGREVLRWRLYEGQPSFQVVASGVYHHEPVWYRQFLYREEQARGLDHIEDLASPGRFRLELNGKAAHLVLATEGPELDALIAMLPGRRLDPAGLRERESARRAALAAPLARAADAYIVRRGAGRTIIAGYPWFGDWGRDTFIALRGLCLATGRLDDAGAILDEWAGAVSEGMLPNRFPDRGEEPEFNAVDASLWYVVVAQEYFEACAKHRRAVPREQRERIHGAIRAILEGYANGTRHGIRCDDDGLLRSGAPGLQLTWMDARVEGDVITPRRGKPVEIQALWLNALAVGEALDSGWGALLERGQRAFEERFWDDERGYLYDVIDVDGHPGAVDPSLRPNQLYAIGGLPLALVTGERARRVLDVVERELLTPLGLRTLAPSDPRYCPRYAGGVRERDSAYHQGTVWPFLIGPFVDAWLRIRGNDAAQRRALDERVLMPLHAHIAEHGLGHVTEVADGDAPHRSGGCPFQAWSVAELLRATQRVRNER